MEGCLLSEGFEGDFFFGRVKDFDVGDVSGGFGAI